MAQNRDERTSRGAPTLKFCSAFFTVALFCHVYCAILPANDVGGPSTDVTELRGLRERYNRLQPRVLGVVVVGLVQRQTVSGKAMAGTNSPRRWRQTDSGGREAGGGGGGGGGLGARKTETETSRDRERQREPGESDNTQSYAVSTRMVLHKDGQQCQPF